MAKIIGIIVVIASVLGGFILSGGKVAALIHPFEVMIIGGAALGGFLQANPGSTTKIVFKKSLQMFGNRFTHKYYLEVLGMLYEILNKSRREGMMAIEADIEDPAASPIFSKYPAILKDERMITCASCPRGTWPRMSWKACSTWSSTASRRNLNIRLTPWRRLPTACPRWGSWLRYWVS